MGDMADWQIDQMSMPDEYEGLRPGGERMALSKSKSTKPKARKNPIGPVDPHLKSLGFTRIHAVREPYLTMEARGRTKSGKSRLILKMPQPIGVLNLDRSFKTLLAEEEFKSVDVIIKDLTGLMPEPGEQLEQKDAQLVEREFQKCYNALLEHKHTRGVGCDKGTTLWEVARFAEFGRASVKAHHYVPVNLRMRGYFGKAQDYKKSVLFIHDLKEEWVGDKPTGRWIVDGFKYASSLVQENLDMWREEDGGSFVAKLVGSALNAPLVGEEWYDDDIDFIKIAAQITETLPSQWR